MDGFRCERAWIPESATESPFLNESGTGSQTTPFGAAKQRPDEGSVGLGDLQ